MCMHLIPVFLSEYNNTYVLLGVSPSRFLLPRLVLCVARKHYTLCNFCDADSIFPMLLFTSLRKVLLGCTLVRD